MSIRFGFAFFAVCFTLPFRLAADEGDSAKSWDQSVRPFLQSHCVDCHSGQTAEAGLDLAKLSTRLDDSTSFAQWVKVHDKLKAGEMPPADMPRPPAKERDAVLEGLGNQLHAASATAQAKEGRVQFRRLNRSEYENTLKDLLSLPNLEAKDMLPADAEAHGFDNVGSALNLSYVQMARYLEAADAALDQAMRLGPKPEPIEVRLKARTNGRFGQVLRKQKEAVPVGEAVGLLRQPNTAQAPWWWSKVDPPVDGNYRIRMQTFGFIWDQGEVLPAHRVHTVTYFAVQGTTKRPLATFDISPTQDKPSVHDFEAFLKQGDQIQIWFETLDDRNKGQRELSEYRAPGVAVDWLEVEGPIIEEWPPASYERLFGNLPSEPWTADTGLKEPPIPIVTVGVGKRAQQRPAKRNKITLYHVVSQNPNEDARRLLQGFATKAFRRPVQESELDDILALEAGKLDQKYCFQEAMRIGFQAILCSPEFLFFDERPGELDDYALASRLSYFLWNSMPDEELFALASRGQLNRPEVLKTQVERMLADPKSARFVENFTGQWLDLSDITVTEPDEILYPEFDRLLLDSMVKETRAYFEEMLRRDLPVEHLVDSDFAIVNARLAEHYGIRNVEGVEMRRVPLPEDSPRGGFLTQASILKVTANGTTTSPVTRGAWVLDRLLGQPAPPPPPNVPAVEPDLRGTTTIREQLAKHRKIESCASCHRRIDPPGFALENFDVIGGWRERYRSLENGDPAQKQTSQWARPVRYKLGPPVDASGVAPGGEQFQNIADFRRILLEEKEQLARNLVEKLLVYSTGAGVQFADRKVVEAILKENESAGYGMRSLIHSIVQSPPFRNK